MEMTSVHSVFIVFLALNQAMLLFSIIIAEKEIKNMTETLTKMQTTANQYRVLPETPNRPPSK